MEKKLDVIEYALYGKKLKTIKYSEMELSVTEGLQYITPLNGGKVYVLESILPKSRFLIGNEFYSGNTELLPIDEHCFCERPDY